VWGNYKRYKKNIVSKERELSRSSKENETHSDKEKEISSPSEQNKTLLGKEKESSNGGVTLKEEYNQILRRQDDNSKTKNDNDCINEVFTNNTLDAPNVFAPFNIPGINNPHSSIISILIEIIHNIGIIFIKYAFATN